MFKHQTFASRLHAVSHLWLVGSLAFFTALSSFVSPASSQEALKASPAKAQSAVNFTIVIPEVLRIVENIHLSILQASPGLPFAAQQRIVVLSTLGKGFCMDLALAWSGVAQWKLNVSGSRGSWLKQTASGYQLCFSRAGRYELALDHEFALQDKDADSLTRSNDIAWPVNVSLATP